MGDGRYEKLKRRFGELSEELRGLTRMSGKSYNSLDKAYEHLLVEDTNGYKIAIRDMQKIRKTLNNKSNSPEYSRGVIEAEKCLAQAEKRLYVYKKLSKTKKLNVAKEGLEHYAGILKIIGQKSSPLDKGGYKLGKGFGYGLVLGETVGLVKASDFMNKGERLDYFMRSRGFFEGLDKRENQVSIRRKNESEGIRKHLENEKGSRKR